MKKIFTSLFILGFVTLGFSQTDRLTATSVVAQYSVDPISKAGCEYDTPAGTANSFQGRPDLATFANDFDLPANYSATLTSVTLPLLVYNNTATEMVNSVSYFLYEDNKGIPGAVIASGVATAPTSTLLASLSFSGTPGYVYQVSFDTPALGTVTTGTVTKKYWVGYTATTPNNGNIYNKVAAGTVGETVKLFDTSTDSWVGMTNAAGAATETAIKVIATDCLTLAVSDIAKKQNSVYPNPVKDVLSIYSKNKVQTLELFDTNGRNMNVKATDGKMNVSKLAKGVYILKITSVDGSTQVEKIIKD